MQCNPTTSLAAVQHALSNYLKMALYRQRDAGKDAALDADSDVEPDHDDQSSAWSFDSLGSKSSGKTEKHQRIWFVRKVRENVKLAEKPEKVGNCTLLGKKCASTKKTVSKLQTAPEVRGWEER